MSSGFSGGLLAEIREKAQKRIGENLYKQADGSNEELKALGNAIKDALPGCAIAYGPIKAKERANEKVVGDYGGDWFELKDVVRLTIIAQDLMQLGNVARQVRTRCRASEGLGLMKDQETTPFNSACGYSGFNFVVRLSNGQPAEIQANIPQVMYGQLNKATFCEVIGAAKYNEINGLYNVNGGLGHGLYEIYRVLPSSEKGKEARDLSISYFNYLRGSAHYFKGGELNRKLMLFKAKNRDIFH